MGAHIFDRPPDPEDGSEDDQDAREEGDDQVRCANEYLREGDDVAGHRPDLADPAPRGGAWDEKGRRSAPRDEIGDNERESDSDDDSYHRGLDLLHRGAECHRDEANGNL